MLNQGSDEKVAVRIARSFNGFVAGAVAYFTASEMQGYSGAYRTLADEESIEARGKSFDSQSSAWSALAYSGQVEMERRQNEALRRARVRATLGPTGKHDRIAGLPQSRTPALADARAQAEQATHAIKIADRSIATSTKGAKAARDLATQAEERATGAAKAAEADRQALELERGRESDVIATANVDALSMYLDGLGSLDVRAQASAKIAIKVREGVAPLAEDADRLATDLAVEQRAVARLELDLAAAELAIATHEAAAAVAKIMGPRVAALDAAMIIAGTAKVADPGDALDAVEHAARLIRLAIEGGSFDKRDNQ